MTLNAKDKKLGGGKKFDRPPALEPGTYPVRLVQILELGLQEQDEWKGEKKDPKYELMITYEFLDEFLLDKDGDEMKDKPRWMSESFPFHSLDSDLATSTKRYYALDPDCEYDGNWAELASHPAQATVVNYLPKSGKFKGETRDKVAGLSSMRSKDVSKAPDLVNPPKIFDMDEPDMEVFSSLPQWIQDKMKGNLEFDGSALEKAIEGYKESDGGSTTKGDSKTSKESSQGVSDDSKGSDENDW